MSSASQNLSLTITATFTAEPMKESLTFWSEKFGLNTSIYFSPLNQVFQQLLDPASPVRSNSGVNIFLIRFDDWLRVEAGFETDIKADSSGAMQIKINKNISGLIDAFQTAVVNGSAPYIVCICPPSPLVVDNNNGTYEYEAVERQLYTGLAEIKGVYPVSASEIMKLYPVADYYDFHADKIGHIPYKQIFFDCLGTMIFRKIYAIRNSPYKVIVLDCDQTLWKGVCGEDGPKGIEVDPFRKKLQEFMLEQYHMGMLLCLCSKNNENDVMEVLKHSTEMLIKPEHLISYRINWERKSENLKSLAEELKLGLNCFIFLDDNPVECNEVKTYCPQVLSLCLPGNEEDIPLYLQNIWAFDHLKITAEDQKRTELYKQNMERDQFERQTVSYEDFLNGLELKVQIDLLEDDALARGAQLTQRVNQFNFTTIRRSESDLKKISQADQTYCFTVKAKDRFGDYGFVGLMIGYEQDQKLKVDTFLLSCRAIGKGIEYRMFSKLGELAAQKGLSGIEVTLIASTKNNPAQQFLDLIGAEYRQASAENRIYLFPVEIIKQLNFNASYLKKAALQPKQIEKVAPEIDGGSDIETSDILDDIGKNMNTPKKIHAGVIMNAAHEPGQRVEYVAPRNKIEEKIVKIWEEMLEFEHIGMEDNFFDLGGESIKAIQILSRMREEFEADIPMAILFERTLTIAGLAQAVEDSLLSGMDEDLIAKELAAIEDLSDEEIEKLLKAESN